MSKGQIVVCAFLDIEGSFDNIPREVVIETLNERGVHKITTNWIAQLLSNWLAEMSKSENTFSISTTKGT